MVKFKNNRSLVGAPLVGARILFYPSLKKPFFRFKSIVKPKNKKHFVGAPLVDAPKCGV